MSGSKTHARDGADMAEKRNLPSWMSSEEGGTKSYHKKQIDQSSQDKAHGGKKIKESANHVKEQSNNTHSKEAAKSNSKFSKLLEGVVFVLSGFVNPERSNLRSQALEMGAEYRPDWTSDCTLLICAFPNTPKFRQVEADCGTIVSKEWISECYNQKKLVEIDKYLMHAGKPWRKTSSAEASQDQENVLPRKTQKPVVRRSHSKMTGSAVSEGGASCNIATSYLSPSKVKECAISDLAETILWLESQEEKPETGEVRKIAAEGISTCLQDAIEALEQGQDIQCVIEQWKFVPHVIRELAELEGGSRKGSLTKEELSKLAVDCKRIYEIEFDKGEDSSIKTKKLGSAEQNNDDKLEILTDDAGYDSDATIEMTEEEIDLAYKGLSC